MSTGSEAPISVSTTTYYRGFSMIITQRDPEAKEELKMILAAQINLVNWMMDNGFNPSWNKETNDAILNAAVAKAKPQQLTGEAMTCDTCGGDATLKQGVSQKTGKPWKGIFCKVDKDHVKWIR